MGTKPKKLAIIKQLGTHFKEKHEKGVPRVPAPLHPCPGLEAKAQHYKKPAFHLYHKKAKRLLKVYYKNEVLPFCPDPKYFGVTLDRSLTYR